jgi:hypothetical protein
MNDNTLIYPALFMLFSVLLGLFTPSLLAFSISIRQAKWGLKLVLALTMLAVSLFIEKESYWAISFSCFAVGVFMITVWLSAPGRYEPKYEQRYTFYPELPEPEINWSELDEVRASWS